MEDFVSRDITVVALMTAPRYEAVFARNNIEKALKSVGVPMMISGGVYYGQCMQMMMQTVVEQSSPTVDYILTVDFDSMFTAAHVRRLLSLIAAQENIHALASVQPKRGSGDLLAASLSGQREVMWNGKPIQVDTAHFGLTAISVDRLRQMPKPWFMHEPDANGEWTDGKIDDDVYFWREWQKAGNTVFIDPGTRLGHLEEVVTVFDEEMKLVHLYPNDWSEKSASTVDA